MFNGKLLTKAVRKLTYYSNLNFLHNIQEKIRPNILLNMMDSMEVNTVSDWKNVRKTLLEHENNKGYYTKESIDSLIISYCTTAKKFNLGASYINFLKEESFKPNLATLGKYLKLLYAKNYEECLEKAKRCPESEEKQILECYDDLRKEYPILDSFSLENSILAISLTSQWKKCLDLLEEVKISTVPTAIAYSTIISAAFLDEEENLAWELLGELLQHDKLPADITYLAYLRTIRKIRKKEKGIEKLEKLFRFLQENDLKCGKDVALQVSEMSKMLSCQINFTTVTYQGICKSCLKKLHSFELSNEEFNKLKNKVFENVIVGRDVFVKTNPDELVRFKKFVGDMGKFDVVLDGLNIAYSVGTKQSPLVFSTLVASVVSYFIERQKKVLVLGRAHMNRWPKKNWSYVEQHSAIFLTQNISQDDPYLLYCALNSGKDTIIVTRDLMRGHKFLLKDTKLKMLFNRWLSQRQYQLIRVDGHKGPIFRIPPPFSTLAQRNGNMWHIPYEMEIAKEKNEFHKTWLCLKC